MTTKPNTERENFIDGLLNFKNSEFLNTTAKMMQSGKQVADATSAKYKVEKISIEELLGRFSSNIDQEVIKTAKQKKLTPIGGELVASIKDEKSILLSWDFYYTDSNGQYHKTHSEKHITQEFISQESLDKIKPSPIVFQINPPNTNQP